MKGRQGAAALMAAAAMATPAMAGQRGEVVGQRAALPMYLPGVTARMVYDDPAAFEAALGPRSGSAAAYAGLTDGTIHFQQGIKARAFEKAHEMAHLFDYQMLTDTDRARFAKMLRSPKGDWWATADTGHAGSGAEWFADYYATAATRRPPRRRAGMLVQGQSSAYAEIGPRRLARFKYEMDKLRRERGWQTFKPL